MTDQRTTQPTEKPDAGDGKIYAAELPIEFQPFAEAPAESAAEAPAASRTIADPPPRRRGEESAGRSINQALDLARTAEAEIRVATLEREIVRLKAASVPPQKPVRAKRRQNTDARKVCIAILKGQGCTPFEIVREMDVRGFEGRKGWFEVSGLRLWAELYFAARYGFPKIQRCCRKFIRLVPPFETRERKQRSKKTPPNGEPFSETVVRPA